MAGQPSSKGRAGPGTCAAHWAWVQRTSPSMHDQCPARCSQLPLPVWRGLEASIWPRRFGKRGFLSYSPGLVARAGSIARAALALQWQCMKQNVIVYYKYNYAQGALSHSMPRMWSGRCLAVGREKPAGRRFWVMSKMRPAQHPPPPPPRPWLTPPCWTTHFDRRAPFRCFAQRTPQIIASELLIESLGVSSVELGAFARPVFVAHHRSPQVRAGDCGAARWVPHSGRG